MTGIASFRELSPSRWIKVSGTFSGFESNKEVPYDKDIFYFGPIQP